MRWILPFLFLIFPPGGRSQSNPLADSVRLALLDCKSLPSARYTRYLDLYNVPKKDREKYQKVLSFVVNSLSRYRALVSLRSVPDPEGPRLLVLELDKYRIPEGAWDSLFELGSGRIPQPDTYYNLPVFQLEPQVEQEEYEEDEKYYYSGGQDSEGNFRHAGWYTRKVKKTREKKLPGKKVKKLTDAPWLPPGDLESLRALTHTKYPIGRADWFAVYALWGKAYYRFLGIDPDKGKEKDLEALARLDRKLASDSILKAVTDTKIVTLNNRILVRFATVNSITGSYYWESLDTDEGIDDGDFVLNLIRPKIKAKEIIFGLANGLQAYGLSLANGDLVDVAAINIASHKSSKFQDPQVWSARNCITCHSQGMWELQDKVRPLSRGTVLGILSKEKDQKEVEEVLDAFVYQTEPVIKHDQVLYEAAVKACNGWTPEANANAYESLVHDYFEKPLTLETFSLECGVPVPKLKKLLETRQRVDHTLTGPLLVPPLNTYRQNWENRGFAALMLAAYSP